MSVEKIASSEIKWVLFKIKKLHMLTPDNEHIEFDFLLSTIGSGIPTIENQKLILKKLNSWKAIKIHEEKFDPKYKQIMPLVLDMAKDSGLIRPVGYLLDISQTKFDKIFGEYESAEDIEKYSATEIVSNNGVFYDYDHVISIGKLKIKSISEHITFRGTRAKILYFFYFHKDKNITDDTCKNYADFNVYIKNKQDIKNKIITSGDFSKAINAINRQVSKATKGAIKDLISKKENKRNEANIYHWNKYYS